MQLHRLLLLCTLSVMAGCAGTKGTAPSSAEYVEIDNPAFTLSPNAPPTILVPRSSVDQGVPRGSEILKKGYDTVRGKVSGSTEQSPAPVTSAVQTTPSQPTQFAGQVLQSPINARNRILVLEIGTNGLQVPFSEALKRTDAGTVLDPTQAAVVARYASTGTDAERAALAVKLREDFNVQLLVLISAPDGIAAGKAIRADVYETQGGSLLKRTEARLSGTEAAGDAALPVLAGDVKSVTELAPWYGRVVAVDGDRVYINAGKESGIKIGQMLKIHRGGKVLPGLGFAPGTRVGTMVVSGFVGTNGAYGMVREGSMAQAADLFSLE